MKPQIHRSDGYAFFALINRRVLRRCMHSSWISIKLTCLDTDPLVSLDSFLFLFHFRIHGGLKSRFGGELKEKSQLEARRDALDVFGD